MGMDYRTLAELNAIESPYIIRVGQTLKTAPDVASAVDPIEPQPSAPAERSVVPDKTPEPLLAPVARESSSSPPSHSLSTAKTATPNVPVDEWSWPTEGRVSRAYSEERHKGIDLAGSRGSPVKATAAATWMAPSLPRDAGCVLVELRRRSRKRLGRQQRRQLLLESASKHTRCDCCLNTKRKCGRRRRRLRRCLRAQKLRWSTSTPRSCVSAFARPPHMSPRGRAARPSAL